MSLFRFLTILCSCFHLPLLLQFCLAADRIAFNQSISDGPDGLTLVSPGQRFELGFFSPGTSKKRYLGIWYKTTPDVIVWVANRKTPLLDTHGVFTISSNGTLVILNSTKRIIWSSNISRAAANLVLQLLDTGNLVLTDNASTENNYLWQSFDYPGNTRLPGMEIVENLDAGVEKYLTSWRNTDDPSPGDFSYKLEIHGLPQLVISMGTTKRFRTGPWNGKQFTGLPMLTDLFKQNQDISYKEGFISISDRYNSTLIARLTMNQSGTIQRYILDEKKNAWTLLYNVPNNPCDSYGQCGPNAVCNSNTSPICQCLEGFAPKDAERWYMLDWSGGCVRIEPPKCPDGNGFTNVSGVKLPDMLEFQLKMNMSLSECEAECLRNCSCTAYANPFDASGRSSCLMWYKDLMDIRIFSAGRNEQTLYLRSPNPNRDLPSGSNKKKKKKETHLKIILIPTASGVLFVSLVCGCIILKMKRKRQEMGRTDEDLEVPLLDIATIAAATRSFSQENIIGQGGFGAVYKGNLSTGQEIAVKRLSESSRQGAEEFKNEVILIAKLQHRNLVRLLGCCIQGEERILIYEYMPNESLDHFIFDPNRSKLLIWPKRFDIIMGTARGLLYLHQDSRLKIIHRDLKTSNILLSSSLEPKISDFGLARILEGNQVFVKTERVIGTYGYMAPEYAVDGKFSDKTDVFSFGVLLLEIISGKKNRNFSHSNHHHNLLGHAWLLWNEDRALELMDASLKDSFVASQVQRCIQVGLLCVQKFAEDRPAMSSVLFMLGNEGAILPQPKEPGFFIERSSSKGEMQASGIGPINTGEMMTITQLDPR